MNRQAGIHPGHPSRAGGMSHDYDEIRTVLNRPDLSDEILREVLDSGRHAAPVRALPVPPPRHGLDMPAHDLNPPLAVRLAPQLRAWQRALQLLRPRMKRSPVTARSR
ncbi:hypothetical protein [Roseibium sp. Sym1]|uniref:hypothetical protein n=1 Tax=Roseibium sp. Sym1 TaxID=3016006 RepID=UPI0022B379DD|nr:hypothetical protein [Roseibium sp. Sym1]